VAALLTWFLPGAGHLYMGRPAVALAGFLVVSAIWAVGYALSDGRVFEFLDPELRGPLAVALTPEVGNLGGMLWQMMHQPFGDPAQLPRPYPERVLLGGSLTALAGVLNLCLVVRAHTDARSAEPVVPEGGRAPLCPATLVLAAWILPGLGHWLQGRRKRGTVVFVLLVGLFLAGTLLAQGTNLSREGHFYFWSGQFLLGVPALLVEQVARRPLAGTIPFETAGLTFGCVAGLLNVLAMLDVYGWAEARWLGRDPLESGEPDADPGAGKRLVA
jgi:hypothetical protein